MHTYTALTQQLSPISSEKQAKLAAIEKLVDDEFNDSTMTYLLSVWLKQRTQLSADVHLMENTAELRSA